MNMTTELSQLIKDNNGILLASDAEQAGVSRTRLSKLVEQGLLERTSWGVYVLAGAMDDELFSMQQRAPKVVYSHETALFLHGLSDRTPFHHSITVPSAYKPSQLLRERCKVYYIKRGLIDLGKTIAKTNLGNTVTVYDIERTICDVVRSRNRMDAQIVSEALRRSADSLDLNRLYSYSKEFGVTDMLRCYLGVLL